MKEKQNHMKNNKISERNILLTFAILLLLFPQTIISQNNKESHYKIGQVWSYKTRKHEDQSTLTIVKIDSDSKLGNIIHISITGLKMKNPDSENDPIDTIGHMPFTEKAIDKSVIKLIKEDSNLPDYKEGYDEWRIAFDNKQAGIYKISVSEAVEKAEKNLNKR
jgi:hypothetical protein